MSATRLLSVLVLSMTLAACGKPAADQPGVAREAVSTSCASTALPVWPTSWRTMYCHGSPAFDPVGDANPAVIDAVGSSDFPAVQSQLDANFLYMRIRANLSLGTSGCTCTTCSGDVLADSHGWGYDFDTDGNPSTYEFQLLMNGASNQSGRTLEFNRNLMQSGAVDSPSEKAESTACLYAGADADARVRVDKTTDGSSFGGACDFFVTMAFPLSELASRGINMKAARLVWAGSSAQAQNLSGDIVCDNKSTPTLKTAAADPLPLCFGGCCTTNADCTAGRPTTLTTLSAALTSVATTATVVSTAGYPSTGLLVIDSEYISYSGTTATSFTGLTRGTLSSTAAAHASGAAVGDFIGENTCNTTSGNCECSTSPDSCAQGQFCDPLMKKCRANCTSAAPQGGACSTTGDLTLCCDDGNSCTTNACTAGKCVFAPTGTGTICDDANGCTGSGATETAICSAAGACGTLIVACADDGLGCTSDICQSTDQACVHPTKSAGTVCRAAVSPGCDTAETCNGTSTSCPADVVTANGTSCSDNNACTSGETCNAGACSTPTTTVSCPAPDQCHVAGICNTTTGVCTNTAKPNGTICTDGNACTSGETCNAGVCGTPTSTAICAATDQCHVAGTCDTTSGICSNPAKANGTSCTDGNACTGGETCNSGTCGAPTSNVTCAAPDPCHLAGSCNTSTGVCSNPTKANGTTCTDSNACTSGETCNSGTCGTPTSNVTCAVPDQCHLAGTCDTTSGVCSNPAKASGAICNDGDLCTLNDACNGVGACLSGSPKACNAPATCQTASGASCAPSTGLCTYPTTLVGSACIAGGCNCATLTCDATGGAPGTCEATLTCGNAKLEAGEGCDDGGNVDNDGCSATCLVENGGACNANSAGFVGATSCASGVCDTSFGTPGVCEPALTCGNGKLEAGEGCDDGAKVDGDGCSAACLVENGLACNANNAGAVGTSSCKSGVCDTSGGQPGVCEPALTCGNGKLEVGEGCDDGAKVSGDGCSAACFVENGGACNADASGAVASLSCVSQLCDVSGGLPGVCIASNVCGNGVLEPGEGCDDGAKVDGDGCSAGCFVENNKACNVNAIGVTGSASCVSSQCDTTGGLPGVCEPLLTCGNGKLEVGEGCDDGAKVDGDGCSAGCLVEDTKACNANISGAVGGASCASTVCDATGGQPGVCEPALTCGNGKLEAGEGCDDGATVDGDGCSAGCLVVNNKACNVDASGAIGSASCASTVCDVKGGQPGVCEAALTCGNGKLETGEGCDDGGQTGGDGCNASCLVESASPCNTNNSGATGNSSCASGQCDLTSGLPGVCAALGVCGNGVLEPGEGCDDGGTTAGDGCGVGCFVENGTACNANAAGVVGDGSCLSGVCDRTSGVPGVCEPALTCGNGKIEPGEGCDEGNTMSINGCGATCLLVDGSPCSANPTGAIGSLSCASGVCDTSGGQPGVCEPALTCGNGKLEAGEGCDDGGILSGDGCTSTCLVENGRACHTGNAGLAGSASCASGICDTTIGSPGICEPIGCGNGKLEAGEGCDDGGTLSGDGCSAGCLVENGGACNANATGATGDASCASARCDQSAGAPGKCISNSTCGDGKLQAGEGCDDGNSAAGDGCSTTCFVEDGRACNGDDAGATGNASCASSVCDKSGGGLGVCEQSGTCGNGKLEAGEACDDGSVTAGDGCSATCLVENGTPCGSNLAGVTGSPSCASGVCDTTAASGGVCEPALTCGNGKLEAGEACDDGNTSAGDGCDGSCRLDNGRPCQGDASSCASGVCDTTAASGGVCEPALTCGNGKLEADEACDDGNVNAGDGCSATCTEEGQGRGGISGGGFGCGMAGRESDPRGSLFVIALLALLGLVRLGARRRRSSL